MFIVLTEITHEDGTGDRVLTPVKVSIRCICGYFTKNNQTLVLIDKNMVETPVMTVVESEEEIDARIECVVQGGAVIGTGTAAAEYTASISEPMPEGEQN